MKDLEMLSLVLINPHSKDLVLWKFSDLFLLG